MYKRFSVALIALMLTTSAVEGFTYLTGSWQVHKVEVSEEEASFTPPGQYCYMTNKKKRDAFSLVVDKDGVFKMEAWLSNIDLPKTLAVRDIHIRLDLVRDDKERLFTLSNTIVRDASDLGQPGDAYLWHTFDGKLFTSRENAFEKSPRFLVALAVTAEGSLSFVNTNGEKVSEFDIDFSYGAVQRLRGCYNSIKAPGPRKKL